MAGGGISRGWTTESDGRRQVSNIGDRRRSGERRTPWRYDVGYVCWGVDEGCPGEQMIPCIGATGGVGGQGRRRTLP